MANYFMLGGDGQEYGPVSAEQLRQWLAEGRANAQTQLRDASGGGWMPLGATPEFNGPSPYAGPGPAAYAQPSQVGAIHGGATQSAGISVTSPGTQRLANTLGAGSGWMKFSAVMLFILSGVAVIGTFGIALVIVWMPIWLGVVLWRAAAKADVARKSGTTADLHKSLRDFGFFYQLAGIFGIVALCLTPVLLAALAIPAFARVRAMSRQKAVMGNLRIINSAAETYMFEKEVTQASYSDLVGTEPDKQIRAITPVAGEDYSSLIITQGETQITISSEAFGTLTFND